MAAPGKQSVNTIVTKGKIMNEDDFFKEWRETIKKEKCDNVDIKTGFRDCWNFICMKNHTWRHDEIRSLKEGKDLP